MRLNSSRPRSASRSATCMLTADCAFWSECAAAEKDPLWRITHKMSCALRKRARLQSQPFYV